MKTDVIVLQSNCQLALVLEKLMHESVDFSVNILCLLYLFQSVGC